VAAVDGGEREVERLFDLRERREFLGGEFFHARIGCGEKMPAAFLQRAGDDFAPRREEILRLGRQPGVARMAGDMRIETREQPEP